VCSRYAKHDIHRIDGHVFQPLMQWYERLYGATDQNWTMRSRCWLDYADEKKRIAKAVSKFEIDMHRKVTRVRGDLKESPVEVRWDDGKLDALWKRAEADGTGSISVGKVREFETLLGDLIRAPIDKCGSDAVAI
jgi:hypothetical protein